MRNSYGTYDGRKPEPPYDTAPENEARVAAWRSACASIGGAVLVISSCERCWWPLPNVKPLICAHCGKEINYAQK